MVILVNVYYYFDFMYSISSLVLMGRCDICILIIIYVYIIIIIIICTIHYSLWYRLSIPRPIWAIVRYYIVSVFFFFSNGIVHLRTAPATAENAVKTTKHALSAALADCKNKNLPKSMILNKFLLGYRNILLRGKHHQY